MILLDSDTVLVLNMSPDVDIDVDVTYVDIDSTTYEPDSVSSQPVSGDIICSTPEGSPAPKRKITLISIRNTEGAASTTMYLTKGGSPGSFIVSPSFVLLAGEMVHYIDGEGFVYYAADGTIK